MKKNVQNFFQSLCCTGIVPLWNDLPQNIVSAPTLHVFKNCLKHFNLFTGSIATFCRVTGTSGNSGQEKFRTAWGNFGHETKIASIMFLYYLCHCRLLF